MKGRWNTILILCVCCVLFVVSCIDIVLAFPLEPTVCYDGKSNEISFVNTQQTDLFAGFKEVIPGDQLTQTIHIRGKHIQNNTKVYLKTEIVDGIEIPEEILISVYAKDKLISKGHLERYRAEKNGVFLHQFDTSGVMELHVVLDIPVSIGNEVAGLCKELKWTFVVEEDGVAIPPQTGDGAVPVFSMIVSICSFAVILFLIFVRQSDKF